ncbi:MAG: inositol monophosphatase family protein [Pseudomonadota bacterium]
MSELDFTTAYAVSDSARAEYLAFAQAAVRAAGQAVLPFFRTQLAVDNKREQGFDPVTEGDRAGERRIRELLAARYPDHGIYGEEYGYSAGNGLTWMIDPIDGTRAFVTGMLHWGVLLGLFDGQQPVVGAMYQPYTDELFWGDGRSAGFERAGERRALQTSGTATLSQATLATTGTQWFSAQGRTQFDALRSRAKMTRMGGDCYLYAMVAMGSLDIATDANLNAYDVLGLIPIIRGAGGAVATYDDGNPSLGGTVLACGSQALLDDALAAVRGAT